MGLMSLQHEIFGITPFMSIKLLLTFINKYYRSIMPFQPSWVSTKMPLNFNLSVVYSSIILLFSSFLCYCNCLKALARLGSCSGFAFKMIPCKTNASLSRLVFWVKYSCSHYFQKVAYEGMTFSQVSDVQSRTLRKSNLHPSRYSKNNILVLLVARVSLLFLLSHCAIPVSQQPLWLSQCRDWGCPTPSVGFPSGKCKVKNSRLVQFKPWSLFRLGILGLLP